ncbi:MAG: UDP-N-acetylglucosamine 1-carboxyvinyltransferase [Bacilli bacterium]|nr:UDP-N-acetylglucosamine 1-carboxyvinyltransferase [Bacilli bacterium]
MKVLKIKGGKNLTGTINIGGAKNSAVALVPAAILSDKTTISNVPEISDIKALKEILTYLNVDYNTKNDKLFIETKNIKNKPITLEHSKLLRASYYFMGALLGKFKHAEMYFPGGCTIGERPIDLHLKGFESLGATITVEGEKYIIDAKELKGTTINLAFPSVGATINIILAAVYAKGKTVINNAAKEPEVGNVIDFLNSMGSNIKGKDTSTIIIEGDKTLKEGKVKTIPDRIEAGTYIIAGVMCGSKLKINNIIPKHIQSLIDKLHEMNANIIVKDNYIIANKTENLKPINVTTETYPGFPTDLQQPITTLLALANGTSTITETIYENRFQNVKYLNQMGANIKIKEKTLTIKGPIKYQSSEVVTTDLRAGAALILAALSADGLTTIKEVKYVLRGYGNIIKKLSKVGVEIKLEDV